MSTSPSSGVQMSSQADLWAFLIKNGSSTAFKYPSSFTWSRNGTDKDGALDILRNAHPTMEAEITKGIATHFVLTGGKLLWPDAPIPRHVSFPSHAVFTKDVQLFRSVCPVLLGRDATYEDVFWLIYQAYLTSGARAKRNISITESISAPCFKFFVDLDLTFGTSADAATWKIFVKTLVKHVAIAIAKSYPSLSTKNDSDRVLEFVVMCTPYRPKGDGQQKAGIHLVWPNLIVDKPTALVLAVVLEEHLSSAIRRDRAGGENSWRDAIDSSVYNTGLRLIGCVKATRCPKCAPILQSKRSAGTLRDHVRDSQTELCHPDVPTGFILGDVGTIYKLTHIVRADGVMYTPSLIRERISQFVYTDPATNTVFDLSARALTSIRVPAGSIPTQGFFKPEHLCAESEMRDPWRRTTTLIDPVSGADLTERRRMSTQERTLAGAKELIVDVDIHEKLEEALRRFSPEYRDIQVDRVWGFPLVREPPLLPLPRNSVFASCRTKYKEVWVLVKGPGSRYCHQKHAEHATNRVRFVIDFKGRVVQGCWSIKTHGQDTACCKRTTSENSKLRYNLYDAYEKLMISLFASRKRSIADGDQENSISSISVMTVQDASAVLYM